ncbi:extracellular tyrosine-protein kinase PKDCC-like [Ptychodera flava]|uniref:extracellular tyrosine-protein kinase PKDCC-like n=1 Tax=Ptychodera flava TaxID=63121 RepID=UPI00396A42B6
MAPWRPFRRRPVRLISIAIVALVFIPYLGIVSLLSENSTGTDTAVKSELWREVGFSSVDFTQVDRALESVVTNVTKMRHELSLLGEEILTLKKRTIFHQDKSKFTSMGDVNSSHTRSVASNFEVPSRYGAGNAAETSVHHQKQPNSTNSQPLQSGKELFGCSIIDRIAISRKLGTGTSKEVHLGEYKGQMVAIKRVTPNVEDVKACLRRKKFWKESDCYLYANYKIVKEILLSQQLHHQNILKLLGFCVRSENTASSLVGHGVISVTEVGKHIKMNEVKGWDWQKRLKLCIEIASLLDYLEHSPLGSLIMTDFKLDQMFFVDSSIKLGDMDDMNNIEGDCNHDSKCMIQTKLLDMACTDNKCIGLNAKFNLHRFNEKLLSQLLMSVPRDVATEIEEIRQRLNDLSISAAELYNKLIAIQQKS